MMTLYHSQQQGKCKTPFREKQTVLWQRCMTSFTKWDVINVVSSKNDAIKIAKQCNLLHHQSVAFLVAVENHPERLSACWLIRESPTLLTLNSMFFKQGTCYSQQQRKCKMPLRKKQTVLWQRCMMSCTKWEVIEYCSIIQKGCYKDSRTM